MQRTIFAFKNLINLIIKFNICIFVCAGLDDPSKISSSHKNFYSEYYISSFSSKANVRLRETPTI